MFQSTEPTPATQRSHRNHGLFSDHYLDATLPGRPDWEALAEKARPVMDRIAEVFGSFAPSANEAQTEKDLVRPVLILLGHDYEVQPALEAPDGTKRPDYILYKDAAAVAANKNRPLNDELLRGAPSPLATPNIGTGRSTFRSRRVVTSSPTRTHRSRSLFTCSTPARSGAF